MDRIGHIRLMASYNELMNARIYEASSHLSFPEITSDRHAFFSSILGTLNHIAVGDSIWLKRFAGHPANYNVHKKLLALPDPKSLDHQLFPNFDSLNTYRKMLDDVILEWTKALNESELDYVLQYSNLKGIVSN